jgi:DNA-binding NtrC family response regulator
MAIQESLVEICREVLHVDPLTAGTAAEALTALETNRPAVLLLDLTLPDTNGDSVVREIEARGWRDEVRVVILSAQSNVPETAANLRAFSHLSKPFTLNAVIETLKQAEAG